MEKFHGKILVGSIGLMGLIGLIGLKCIMGLPVKGLLGLIGCIHGSLVLWVSQHNGSL